MEIDNILYVSSDFDYEVPTYKEARAHRGELGWTEDEWNHLVRRLGRKRYVEGIGNINRDELYRNRFQVTRAGRERMRKYTENPEFFDRQGAAREAAKRRDAIRAAKCAEMDRLLRDPDVSDHLRVERLAERASARAKELGRKLKRLEELGYWCPRGL